jgi:predicted DNA-binding protein (MmcQ/YjbR family)
VTSEKPKTNTRKSEIDAVLFKLPGVSGKKINGLDAYFVNDRMFACISGNGVGLRVPVATANELHFSRENVVAFQPAGLPSSKEWVQIDRDDATEYEKDFELFQASYDFVKGSRTR